MKIICSKEDLNTYVQIVQKAVSKQNVLPILSGIHISADNHQVVLTAKNSEMEIQCSIPANVQESGSFVIDARYFTDIVRKLPHADVILETDNQQMKIQCNRSFFTINGYNASEYPITASIPKINTLSIKQSLLKHFIKQTIFSVTTGDDVRPYLTGVNLVIKNQTFTLVSTDGHRLSHRTFKIDDEIEFDYKYELNIIIPGKTLNELARILQDDEEMIQIAFTEKQVCFYLENITIISQLLEGEYIHYEQIIPKNYQINLKINTSLFLDAIERASLLSKDNYNKIILNIDENNKLIITSDNSEIGRVREEIPAVVDGKELQIAFNSRYLIDVLKVIDSEEIEFKLIEEKNPGVIYPVDYEGYTYVIMPVRLS